MMQPLSSQPFTSEAQKPKWTLTREAIILRMPVAKVEEPTPLEPVVAMPLVRKEREPKLPKEPNAHVLAYMAQQKGTTPALFIRLQCKAVGISYRMLVTKKHPRMFYEERKSIIEATVAKFPEMSSVQLGILFKRHHSAILYTLGRLSRRREQMLAYQKKLRDAKKVTAQ